MCQKETQQSHNSNPNEEQRDAANAPDGNAIPELLKPCIISCLAYSHFSSWCPSAVTQPATPAPATPVQGVLTLPLFCMTAQTRRDIHADNQPSNVPACADPEEI